MKEVTHCPICNGTSFKLLVEPKDFTVSQQTFRVQHCQTCSFGITTPQPDNDELGKYYLSEDYISHSEKARSLIDKIYQYARDYTLRWKHSIIQSLTPQKNLLDFGCGTGNFLEFMQRQGYLVVGVEPSAKARESARKKTGREKVLETIDSVNGQFDIITLWHVLEHIPDLNETVSKLRQRLKAGGYLIIAVPNLNSWDSTHYGNYWAALDTPRHLWHFTQSSIPKLLANHSLKLTATVPMKLDAFYVSLLSEKYRNDRRQSIGGMINAVVNGLRSNRKAQKTGEYSSLIYIVQHEAR